MPTKTGRPTKAEVVAAEADAAYWWELADLVPGWRLYGWSYRTDVTYITPGQYGPHHDDTIEMTGRQRDDLIKALRGG